MIHFDWDWKKGSGASGRKEVVPRGWLARRVLTGKLFGIILK